MRFAALLIAVFGLVCALPARAQEFSEWPEDQIAAPILAQMQKLARQDQFLDLVRLWVGDVDGDDRPDAVAQAAYSTGGSAVSLRHIILSDVNGAAAPLFTLDLNAPVVAVARRGKSLHFTLATHLPQDALCCPSGRDAAVVAIP